MGRGSCHLRHHRVCTQANCDSRAISLLPSVVAPQREHVRRSRPSGWSQQGQSPVIPNESTSEPLLSSEQVSLTRRLDLPLRRAPLQSQDLVRRRPPTMRPARGEPVVVAGRAARPRWACSRRCSVGAALGVVCGFVLERGGVREARGAEGWPAARLGGEGGEWGEVVRVRAALGAQEVHACAEVHGWRVVELMGGCERELSSDRADGGGGGDGDVMLTRSGAIQ